MGSVPHAEFLQDAGLAKDRILLPQDDAYTTRQNSYFSCIARALQPSCIVQPTSAQEVSATVQSLVASKTPFAVRSGGHTNWVGANTIGPGGVTIDLGRMNWVRVPNDEKDVADIGPGCLWGQVYAELEKHGLTVAGGREGNVGVAGLILGGGIAFYTGRHGLSCDNVVEFEVVLSSGEIVKARCQGKHAELFRALKGGSGNFGIVTNFRMRALQASEAFAGMTVHPKEAIPQAIAALTEFTDNVVNDVDSVLLCFFTYMPDFKDVVVVGALIQVAGVASAPAYKKWLDMPTISNNCKPTSISKLAVEYSQAQNYHNIWFTATFRNDGRIVAKAAELHAQLVEELKAFIADGDFVTQCLFQPFPVIFGQHSAAAGGNITGIEEQSQNGLLWLAVAQVRTPEQHRFAHARVQQWCDSVKEFAATVDGNLGYMYLNYADGEQDPLASYGKGNLGMMRDVAARYDPQGVFQKLCRSGFRIDRGN